MHTPILWRRAAQTLRCPSPLVNYSTQCRHAHVVPLIRTQVISKALSQNKELKLQLIELQDRFVALTNDGMERASELQTVQHQRSANS